MINKNSLEYTEVAWSLLMARRSLENYWKDLGPSYDLSYDKRLEEANWYLDWALHWVDELK